MDLKETNLSIKRKMLIKKKAIYENEILYHKGKYEYYNRHLKKIFDDIEDIDKVMNNEKV